MMEGFYTFRIIWANTTREKKRCIVMIGFKDAPVELLTIAAY